MEKRAYNLSFAGQERQIHIPQENISAEITFTDLEPLIDLRKSFFDALENPIGCLPLREMLKPGQKLALVVASRVTDWMLGVRDNLGLPLLDLLNHAGIKDKDITIVYAAGLHRIHKEEIEKRFGSSLLKRVKLVLHDPRVERDLSFCGITSRGTPVWVNRTVVESDVVLGFGEISPTIQGGWCGGGKIILPGVAGKDSIESNHALTIAPQNTWGLADRNLMRLDMEEAAGLGGLNMKIDILINRKQEIVALYAGDFIKEHRAALPKAREIWMTRMQPTDIAVAYPTDVREPYLMRSMFGSLEAADWGTIDKGIIILVLSAQEGWFSPEDTPESHGPDFFKLPIDEMAKKIVRRDGDIRSMTCLYSAKKMLVKKRVFLVSEGISPNDAEAFGFAYSSRSFDDALNRAFEIQGNTATICVNLPREGVAWRTSPWIED